MDDILLLYVTRADFQHEPFLENFCESQCYKPPLRLEKGGDNTFLETTFEITEKKQVRHWLKNENEIGKQPKTWRYAHFKSYGAFEMKKRGIFVLPGFAKFTVKKLPAKPARKGINPFTREECIFKAKPARKVVKARPAAALKKSML